MASTQRLEQVLEREAPSWGVEPTTPEVRRLTGLDFAVLWGDLGIGLLVLVTGGLLVPGLGLPQALLAIAVGSLIGCIPLALVGRAGAREGVPGMVLLRPVLGTRGSYVPSVLNVAQLIGWTAFELWAMALVASRIAAPLGAASFYAWLGVAALVCVLLSLGGPVLVVRRWMERFGAWVLAALALWISVRVATTVDLAALWRAPGTGGFPATFGAAVDLVIAMPISWIPLVADYNRFARRDVSSAGGTYVGYLIANVWLYALGALLVVGAGATPSPLGIADAIATLAGGALVLVVLLVGETDEAFADIYSAAVSSQNLAPRIRQRPAIVAVAAVGVALAVWLFGQPDEGVAVYESFLFLIGSVFVPLFAVFVADYYVVNRSRYEASALFDPHGRYRFRAGFNVPAIASWLVGFAVYQWALPTGPTGWVELVSRVLPPSPFGEVVPASVVSFAAAFGVYLVFRGAARTRSAAQGTRRRWRGGDHQHDERLG